MPGGATLTCCDAAWGAARGRRSARPFRAFKIDFGAGELTGAMFPFAKTRKERLDNGDSRLSLEERYPTGDERAALMAKAARQLVDDRLLLEEDAKSFGAVVN
jgi:hypothetical protein